MIVTRLFEPALAQASYLVGCAATGEALVVDPTRDIDHYADEAARAGLRIAHVTETHIHADFLSGARELAARTGARLYLSDEGDAAWKYRFADEGTLIRDGSRITVGRIHVDVVATPGHTPEHLMFLVTDTAAADQPIAAITGDFLFVGDVGRPDLLERAANIKGTMEAGAHTLWKSLRKLEAYPDWLQIWPGHGAGSACGKGISAIPSSTLGYERRYNWAFSSPDEATFVENVLAGQPEPPNYFATMKRVNKDGPPARRTEVPPVVASTRLPALLRDGASVTDTRSTEAYAAGHVRGTLNLPFGAQFVTWCGWLLPYDTDLYFVMDDPSPARVAELTRQLALIGLDRVAGVLDASAIAEAHGPDPLVRFIDVTPAAIADQVEAGEFTVLDVRGAAEFASGHIAGAVHVPYGHLPLELPSLPTNRPLLVHCQAGTRSAIAMSVLERAGVTRAINMAGGLSAWQAAGLPVVTEEPR